MTHPLAALLEGCDMIYQGRVIRANPVKCSKYLPPSYHDRTTSLSDSQIQQVLDAQVASILNTAQEGKDEK